MTKAEKLKLLDQFKQFLNLNEHESLTVFRETQMETEEYEIGDRICFDLVTGEKVVAIAVAQDDDGTVFVLKDCLKDEAQMNEENTTDGEYEESAMRKLLNREILNIFPEIVRDKMKPFENGDYLRLLTIREVFGEEDTDEGQLPYFEDRHNRIAFRGHGSNEMEWWWLQDVVSGSYFAFCNRVGNCSFLYASTSLGVRPAFKI